MITWAKRTLAGAIISVTGCAPVTAHELPEDCGTCYSDSLPEYCKPKSHDKEWMQLDEKITIILNGKEFTFGFTKPE